MNFFRRFPIEYQMDSQDCGPASLKMVAKYYGRYYSLQYLRDLSGITKEGVSLANLATGAEKIGLHTLVIRCALNDLVYKVPLPAIVFWNESHFVVVYDADKRFVYVADPAKGHIRYTHEEFRHGWYLRGEQTGVLMAIEPTADFKATELERRQQKDSIVSLLRYFRPYLREFALIFCIMTIVTALQAILPFISKAVIDVGISTSDINFINMVLIGNVCILISVMLFNVMRDWILMHITARVNVALISDYLIKLMKRSMM